MNRAISKNDPCKMYPEEDLQKKNNSTVSQGKCKMKFDEIEEIQEAFSLFDTKKFQTVNILCLMPLFDILGFKIKK